MKSNYVFGAAMALSGVMSLAQHADGATIAAFTFETSGALLNTAVTSPSITGLAAEVGVGVAGGSHTLLTTVYSSPSGNGSAESFSANGFTAVGDYFQFSVPTTGFQDILINFDQGASSTGPKSFSFAYSTNGTTFSTLTAYTVLNTVTSTLAAGSVTTSFSGGTVQNPVFAYAFDLTSITGLDNNPLAAFRLVSEVTATATGATRVDNFVVSGTAAVLVPEPATLGVVLAAAGGLAARRRRA